MVAVSAVTVGWLPTTEEEHIYNYNYGEYMTSPTQSWGQTRFYYLFSLNNTRETQPYIFFTCATRY